MPRVSSSQVGVVIPTYQAETFLPKCLPPVMASPLNPKVLVIDSSSKDRTVEVARSLGADTVVIPQAEFNHGGTRELARQRLATPIVVMLTQDAVPTSPDMLSKLIGPIVAGEASVSYARQIPHDGAGYFEAFPRRFNYPETAEVRGIEDAASHGSYTFFCSNSCCAWSNSALDSIGGFEHTISLEDTIATAKLLRAGHKIAYCSDAIVKHSHRYTLSQEFARHFDTGLVRAAYKSLLLSAGGDERRGLLYTRTMLNDLARNSPAQLPYAVAIVAAKLLGYRVGFHGRRLPLWAKRRLSSLPHVWSAAAKSMDTGVESLRTERA